MDELTLAMIIALLGRYIHLLFQRLARKIKIIRPLTATLPPGQHITFYDALGHSPQVLDFAHFNNFEFFTCFLQHYFKDRPGRNWLEACLYHLVDARTAVTLTKETWEASIRQGSHVKMLMLLDYALQADVNKPRDRCPLPNCYGLLQNTKRLNLYGTVEQCCTCGVEVDYEYTGCNYQPLLGACLEHEEKCCDDQRIQSEPEGEIVHAKVSLSEVDSQCAGDEPIVDVTDYDVEQWNTWLDEVGHFKRVLRIPQALECGDEIRPCGL